MPRPRKFRPGEPIASIADMNAALDTDGFVFLFHEGRPTHAAVVRQQRYATLLDAIAKGRMRRVVVTEEWASKNEPATR